jgi:4-diphosphocytidyl-2-C-methyl-D-erythritol kinase
MKLRAYAKINIGLNIVGKRQDGYHDLETIFHEIDLFDEIELMPNSKLAMTADSILVPIDNSNLCLKAAELLQKERNVRDGVMIHLKKNIPIGAGLGGGSSDAAAVLRGLNQMWKLNLKTRELRQLGAQIGSDVPFFIEGGSAYATGRGEILEQISFDIPYWIVLVTPMIYVSTAWAYRNLKIGYDKKGTGLRETVVKKSKSPGKWQNAVQNDFEQTVFETYPDIRETKEKLVKAGASFALMSGSGSSVFGIFENEQKAFNVRTSFPKNYQVALTVPSFNPSNKPPGS